MFSGEQKANETLHRIGWLLAELVVVFIGVYTAFLLSQNQQEQQQQLRREQIHATLRESLEGSVEGTRLFVAQFDSVLYEPFMTQYEAGERPPLQPIYFHLGTMYTRIWESMLESGGLDALDVETLNQLEEVFGQAPSLVRINEMANDYSSEILAPNMGAGSSEFYDPETGRLREKYIWYPYVLQNIKVRYEQWTDAADSLLTRMKRIEGE